MFIAFTSSQVETVVPAWTRRPWSDLKYGTEKSTTSARSSVIVTCDSTMS